MRTQRVLPAIIMFVLTCHTAGLLWIHLDISEEQPKVVRPKKVVVNTVALQPSPKLTPTSIIEQPILASVATQPPASTAPTPPPAPPVPTKSTTPPTPPPPKPAPPKTPPPKPIAQAKPQNPKPTPPKPTPIAKPTPKPATPVADPKPTPPTLSPEKQALLAKAKESLGQINRAPAPSQALNSPTNGNPDLAPLNLSLSSSEFGSGEMAQYETLLAMHLKMNLKLPEIGSVKLTLTLDKNGRVLKHSIKQSLSSKNKDYVESHITNLLFPPFGTFFKEDTRTFELTLTNAS